MAQWSWRFALRVYSKFPKNSFAYSNLECISVFQHFYVKIILQSVVFFFSDLCYSWAEDDVFVSFHGIAKIEYQLQCVSNFHLTFYWSFSRLLQKFSRDWCCWLSFLSHLIYQLIFFFQNMLYEDTSSSYMTLLVYINFRL